MNTISETEKNDILLALALAFEKKIAESDESKLSKTSVETAQKSFAAIGGKQLERLKDRAAFFDSLSEENRQIRQEFLRDKIRRRGILMRLDEHINPTHFAETLRQEPDTVRQLILRNLPPDLSRRLAFNLETDFNPEDAPNTNEKPISNEIISLVKRKFLTSFAALENIYEPDKIDKFSGNDIDNFIRHLGMREIALVCRGINSKETLAAFLSRFDESAAREIALYITELEKVKPYWVAQANELIRLIWSDDLPTDKVLRRTGLHILAETFAFRDDASSCYTAQKLTVREAKNWLLLVKKIKENMPAADDKEKLKMERRRKAVINSATKFIQTGRV